MHPDQRTRQKVVRRLGVVAFSFACGLILTGCDFNAPSTDRAPQLAGFCGYQMALAPLDSPAQFAEVLHNSDTKFCAWQDNFQSATVYSLAPFGGECFPQSTERENALTRIDFSSEEQFDELCASGGIQVDNVPHATALAAAGDFVEMCFTFVEADYSKYEKAASLGTTLYRDYGLPIRSTMLRGALQKYWLSETSPWRGPLDQLIIETARLEGYELARSECPDWR